MDLLNDIDRLITKKPLEQTLKRIPSLDESVNGYIAGLLSKSPLRPIGANQSMELLLAEENRQAHIHILGTTREGKSKLLEQFIRHDIDNGFGSTLLDPSDNGQTAYDILSYCQRKKIDKVCLIDPHDCASFIPSINPLKWRVAAAEQAQDLTGARVTLPDPVPEARPRQAQTKTI